MPLREIRELPITAFRLLLLAWREEDDVQRKMTTQLRFIASNVKSLDEITKILS